jgi:hypothetical protein
MALGTVESAAVIVVLLGNISAWSKMIFDARKNGRNGKPCPLHAGMVTQIETQKTELTDELKTLHQENRDDHKKIFEDIKGLSIAVAGAASAAATAAVASATASRKRGKT